MELLLEKIAQHTEPKQKYQIVVSDKKTDFVTYFNPPIRLNKKFEIALLNLETYYSIPNIEKSNNQFHYSHDGGTTWNTIELPEGSYGIDDINDAIQFAMKRNGHNDTITISANTSTLKAVLMLENNYQVDFNHENTLASVLGFEKRVYSEPYQESENIVNIMNVNSILVKINIIGNSYVKGATGPVIYSFFPNVNPGHKIIQEPHNLVFLPVIMDTIDNLHVTLTDQNGKLLNLRGEEVTIRFKLQEA